MNSEDICGDGDDTCGFGHTWLFGCSWDDSDSYGFGHYGSSDPGGGGDGDSYHGWHDGHGSGYGMGLGDDFGETLFNGSGFGCWGYGDCTGFSDSWEYGFGFGEGDGYVERYEQENEES